MNTISCGVEIDLRADRTDIDLNRRREREVLDRVRAMKPGWTLKLIVNTDSAFAAHPERIGAAVPDGVRIQIVAEDPHVVTVWARRLTERTLLDLMVANVADALDIETRPW
ncbi:hypothetical protein [Demequina iriomotensis]|uniref:hypothetical protein n=1 Tax=Demequina iriomotensis TaxID=1536641 RepID=UPI000784762C|nr:hypothetical protein [Demequina iriomotensis]